MNPTSGPTPPQPHAPPPFRRRLRPGTVVGVGLLVVAATVVAHDATAIFAVYSLRARSCEASDGLKKLAVSRCAPAPTGWVSTAEAARLCGFEPACGDKRYEFTPAALGSATGWIARGRTEDATDVWSVVSPGPPARCRSALLRHRAPWIFGRDGWQGEDTPECQAALAVADRR